VIKYLPAGECGAMRILQVLNDQECGGVQVLADMIEQGLMPHHVAFETTYLFRRPGMPVLAKLTGAWRAARRIWRGDFDALIAYQAASSILVGAVGRLSGCRLRIVHQTCTPTDTAPLIRWLDRLIGALGLYSANIANSAATWAAFAAYPASYRRAMIMIEHGLDAPAPRRHREEARRRFNLPPSRRLLLNVGRLMAQKNQELLIRVLANLPDVDLVLAGGGLKAEAYQALAVALGVRDRLHILGALPPGDIADLYLAADLFVFPSTWETFGIAAVEAAMVGTPMVVADLPALREVLSADEDTPVVFVPPYDIDGWTSAIRAALAAPPPAQVAAIFARTIRRKYSRQRMIGSYLSLLEAKAQGGRGERRRSGLAATAEEVRQ
jgi:glycosyltransferase involved in cell wall biosynthesis